nr:hypothetical protein Iba_chr03bCG3860 [Ipomoea batatas]
MGVNKRALADFLCISQGRRPLYFYRNLAHHATGITAEPHMLRILFELSCALKHSSLQLIISLSSKGRILGPTLREKNRGGKSKRKAKHMQHPSKAHLFFTRGKSSELIDKLSTSLPAFSAVFGPHCLLRDDLGVKLSRLMFPVDAWL